MKLTIRSVALATAAFAAAAPALVLTAPSASAAARDGHCNSGEFCYYFNSNEQGSVSDFTGSLADYGSKQPSCYEFKGSGTGKGKCVKNNAASVYNHSSKTVRVYFNSNYGGTYQDFKPGVKGNLKAALKNQDASHQFLGSGGGTGCSTSGTGDSKSCSQAVAWAKAHVHSGSQTGYYRMCDHLVGLAYGFGASGSSTAYVHWTQIPSSFKHPGSTSVPAGGLAFFSGGSGHVMISIGGGQFISNDIHGNGSYTVTTISEIKSKWGKPYLGWSQPWFKANH